MKRLLSIFVFILFAVETFGSIPRSSEANGSGTVNHADPDGRLGKGFYQSLGQTAQNLGDLAKNAYFSAAYGVAALAYGSDQANQWYGQNLQGLKNAVTGTAQTAYDAAAFASFAAVSSFDSDLAYQAYGGAMQRLGQAGTALTGGDNNSAAYRAGFAAFNVGALFLGGEAGEVGNVGKVGEAADTGAFANHMRQAQTLDVSTAENGAVYWSGQGNQALAEQFAAANEKMTLEMTPGGSWMQSQNLFNSATSPLNPKQAIQVWQTLSQRFAEGTSGNAVGFVNGARVGNTFNTIEYPILLNNPNVINVITGGH